MKTPVDLYVLYTLILHYIINMQSFIKMQKWFFLDQMRVPNLVHGSEALQFEVGSLPQTVTVLENLCLWHRNQHPKPKEKHVKHQ